MTTVVTFKFRIKDGTAGKHLARYATACNQVWNFCVATQREAEKRRKMGLPVRWPTAFDLINLCSGSGALLGLHADCVCEVCRQFVRSRTLHKKCPGFRSSFGRKRSLGWIPIKARTTQLRDGAVFFMKRRFGMWQSRPIDGDAKAGSFVEDSRGRWYFTMACAMDDDLPCGNGEVGIDLGLKVLATMSDGAIVPALQHYRKYEAALAKAARARNKARVRAISAKIANARRHHLHAHSTRIADANSLIVVGNVNAAKLAKTRMAKSVLDAGWSTFRHMLRYKSARRQAVYVEADERFSTQVCSCCGIIPDSSPKGLSGLGMRRWDCSECGASHDRDVNSALNILRVGLKRQPPAGGIPLQG